MPVLSVELIILLFNQVYLITIFFLCYFFILMLIQLVTQENRVLQQINYEDAQKIKD